MVQIWNATVDLNSLICVCENLYSKTPFNIEKASETFTINSYLLKIEQWQMINFTPKKRGGAGRIAEVACKNGL